MKFTSFFKSLSKDLIRYKVALIVIPTVSFLGVLFGIYDFVNKTWPKITWLIIIILGLLTLLGICIFLLYKNYDNKEEFGQIILKHETFKNWEKIRNAKNRIILHAAFYPNYIIPPYKNAIDELLVDQAKLNVKITVILTHPNVIWADEFQKILRNSYSDIEKDFKGAIWASSNFFLDKKQQYNDRIKIIFSERLPLFPVVIIDNELFIGHYCHAITPAPEGFWFHIKNDVIPKLINYIIYDSNDPELKQNIASDSKLKALARYIEDINDAITNGKTIENTEELWTEMNPDNPSENTEEIQNRQNM